MNSPREIIPVLGNSQRLDGGAMFGNAPRALWSRWVDIDDQHRISLACRCLLIKEPDGRHILLETGIGAFFEPTLRSRYGVVESHHVLLDSLVAAGTSHDRIDAVVLSHLHFDHAGGLLGAHEPNHPLALLFPKAKFIVGDTAFARAQRPHPRDRASFIPELQDLLEASGRLLIIKEEDPIPTILGEGYRFHWSHGHTPGLLLTEISLAGGPLLFASDLIPGAPWVKTAITMGYDRFPELLINEKSALMSDLAARGGSLFFTHDPTVATARITPDPKSGFTCLPVHPSE